MNIQRGITHCDTIGDIFKNPMLIKFVAEWHQIKKDGKKIRMRVKGNGEAKFTPEYYEFIREVFDDRTNMEGFLDYVRESIITSDTLYQQLQKYGPDNLVKALLSFDELNDQLEGVAGLTIAGVFKTRIADIIRDAYTQATHMEDDEDEDVIYDTPSLYYALEETLEGGIMPINSDGEMIVKLGDGNTLKNGSQGHIVTSIGGNGEIYEVDRLGNRTDPGSKIITIKGEEILDSREKVITRIKLLEQIIKYHYSDDLEIPEKVESFYANLGIEFESEYTRPEDVPTGNLAHIHFGKYLIEIKNNLEKSLKKIGPTDTKRINELEEMGYEVGISTDLSTVSNGEIPQVKGTVFKIIK